MFFTFQIGGNDLGPTPSTPKDGDAPVCLPIGGTEAKVDEWRKNNPSCRKADHFRTETCVEMSSIPLLEPRLRVRCERRLLDHGPSLSGQHGLPYAQSRQEAS